MSYWSRNYYPASLTCLSDLRRFTAQVLRAAPGSDDVVQVVAELAANAILHTDSGKPDGVLTLHVAAFDDRWQVRIDDLGGSKVPKVQPVAKGDAEAGRGLAIVAALSSEWGVLGDEYARAVWAVIAIPKLKARHA